MKVIINIEHLREQFVDLVINLNEETGIKLNSNELKLLDILSEETRKNNYSNGDVVYNSTSLYFADILIKK